MSKHTKQKRRRLANLLQYEGRRSAENPDPPQHNRQDRDLNRRNATLAPGSLDREQRRVQSTLATEGEVAVYDWRSSSMILEVLRADGCEHPETVPLLRNHSQWSIDEIVGSACQMQSGKSSVDGWLEFGKDLDETAERTWRRVEQGHLRTVSVGYRYGRGDYVDIQPGQTATVGGRSYTAPADAKLRIVTRWTLHEVSLVVIPADGGATIRDGRESNAGTTDAEPTQQGANPNTRTTAPLTDETDVKLFFRFLQKLGLSADVSEVEAAVTWARSNLTDAQYTDLFAIATAEEIEIPKQRTATPTGGNPGAGNPGTDPAAIERARQSQIRQLAADDVPAEMVTRACDEGWTIERASSEFLAAIRERSTPVPETAPAGHSTGFDQRITRESLIAGLLLREGVDPSNPHLATRGARAMMARDGIDGTFLCRHAAGEQHDQRSAIDNGHACANLSFHDIARYCLQLEGRQVPLDYEEMYERAFATANFSAVFGALINAQVLIAYLDYPDTTVAWTQRNLNVPDFRQNNRVRNTKGGKLKKMAKNGGTPEDVNQGTPTVESYALERLAGQVKFDEIVIINDSLDVLDESPTDLGMAARSMIPDAVYGYLARNPNMADGVALFHSDHGNLNASSGLDATKLEVGRAKMARRVENGRNLSVAPRHLLVPESLDYTARQLVRSGEIRGDGATGADKGTHNPHQNRFGVIAEARLDDGGYDPIAEATYAGSTTSWYLAAERSAHTIEVGFRRGTGGVPRLRRRVLQAGEGYGVVFDCCLDFGLLAKSPYGLQKNNA